VDAGLEAPGGKDAADLPRVITGVPVAIEVGLNLVRHGFHPGFVPIGKGGAEGRQLRIGAEFAGLVKPTALFRAAIGELDEIDGNAVHVGLLWVGEHPGSPAPKAAGAIHSDFEKKFIRAEVANWKAMVDMNGYAGLREKGMLRLEGKEYIVKDGDVLVIRHG